MVTILNSSASPANNELFATVTEVQRQLSCAIGGELNQKDVQEVRIFVSSLSSIWLTSLQALHDAQQVIVNFKKEVQELKMRIADLELVAASSNKNSEETKVNDHISTSGSAFQFLFTPFIDSDIFNSHHPKPRFGPNDPERYQDDRTREFGPIAELYSHVDKQFHEFMLEGKEFANIVGGIS